MPETRLAPTCSPASRWRQHLAMLLQLPRARASLTALASLPRCQSAVTVQEHREPTSGGGVCSWRACECGPERACVRARVPPPMAKRVQESLDIHAGVPPESGCKVARVDLASLPRFLPPCQSNQKTCVRSQSPGPAAPAGARGRPLCSPGAWGALGSPDCENPGGLAAIPSLFHLCFVCSERRVDFSSRLVVSPSHIHTRSHILRPSLPPSRWLSRERQLDATIHLQESRALRFPGFRRSPVSGAGELRGRLCAQRSSALQTPASAGRVPLVPAISRDRSQLVPSDTLRPLSSNSWPAAAARPRQEVRRAEPHAAPQLPPGASRAGRKSAAVPRPQHAAAVTPEKVRVPTSNTNEQLLPGSLR